MQRHLVSKGDGPGLSRDPCRAVPGARSNLGKAGPGGGRATPRGADLLFNVQTTTR